MLWLLASRSEAEAAQKRQSAITKCKLEALTAAALTTKCDELQSLRLVLCRSEAEAAQKKRKKCKNGRHLQGCTPNGVKAAELQGARNLTAMNVTINKKKIPALR